MTAKALTPMMKQFHTIKKNYQNMILFFRMGDFYEMFEEDAKVASAVLNLALTARAGTPMCGIPHHAATAYLERLIRAGHKVAICEQVEDPAQAKGIVRREVTRVVTPGTLVDEKLLSSHDNNHLFSFFISGTNVSVAICDISTGEFKVVTRDDERSVQQFIEDEFWRYSPSEIIVSEQQAEYASVFSKEVLCTSVQDWVVDPDMATQAVKDHFHVISLEGFSLSTQDMSVQAVAIILEYLKETQQSVLANIKSVERVSNSAYVVLPGTTQVNLELVHSLSGSKENTLLSVMNRTLTPMGMRLLRQSILKPLRDPELINSRLDAVSALVTDRHFLESLQQQLRSVRDLERLISRIAIKRANARDLAALRFSLEGVKGVRRTLLEKPEFLSYRDKIADFDALITLIQEAILDEPAAQTNEGKMIRPGYSAELDEIQQISQNSYDWIAELQTREREKTGVSSLKVKYNKVVGYFIEVSKANLSSVPDDYERKQTLVNGERFIIPELKEYEAKVLSAREKLIALEEQIFSAVRDKAAEYLKEIQQTAKIVAFVDMFVCFADLAMRNNYVRPSVVAEERLHIVDGRHPVVERSLDDPFVPNSTELDLSDNRIMIVTGPNMAGKSTYLRQTALITLMAQMGSFVPAQEVEIGVVDKIFTRVGASDNLARGQSTFLVEMLETASILNNATERSLIIMDEIGRGTSTYDGLALAWAIIEFLLQNRAQGGRTLFATHYHELTVLGDEFGIGNLNVQVREWNDDVIFLKKVVPGTADKSYGIHVGRLAGLPDAVIDRSRVILNELENKSAELGHEHLMELHAGAGKQEELQLPLFKPYEQEILQRLRELDLNVISPLDALNLLSEFKEKL